MTVQEFVGSAVQFFNICAIYYVIQLVRCALISLAVFAFVFILRKTVMKNKIFLKGALWSLFIPILFAGRMKFFYENSVGVKLFSWPIVICMNHTWICWLYLCGVFVYAAILFHKRKKLNKLVTGMEKRKVDGTSVYVTKMPVTPSTIGGFRPKIVMPEAILKEYDRKEIQLVLLHEKTHIRLGHLLFYFLWNIFRVLLWINPLLTIGTKFFREDMEEICDWMTIRRSEGNAYAYGQLLLKSMRVLQAESEDFNMYATFAGDKGYQNVRQRLTRIARYKSYKRIVTVGTRVIVTLCVVGAFFWTQNVSYDRCNLHDSIVVCDMATGEVLSNDKEALKKVVHYDKNYVYVDAEFLQELVNNRGTQSENICFYCGGYYKLPGIGWGGGFAYAAMDDMQDGTYRIVYEEQEDIFMRILKFL